MKKKTENKVNEIFYRVSISKSYQTGLKELRGKYNIPEKGFKNKKEKEKWWNTLGDKLPQFIDDQVKLNRDHRLSIMYYDHLDNLLFYNKYIKTLDSDNLLCNAFIQKDAGVDRLHIVVNPYATVSDIKEYLSSNRKEIKELTESIRGNFPKTVRETQYKERNLYIYKLSKIPKRKLDPEKKCSYKEQVIAKMVKDKFGGSLMGTDAVRETIVEQRKIREK